MQSTLLQITAPLVLAWGCATASVGTGDAAPGDAGVDEPPPVDAAQASPDDAAAAQDAGSDDLADAAVHTPGQTARVLDGVLTPGEWQDGTWLGQTLSSDWGAANTLTSIVAVSDGRFLWLGLRGSIETGRNALVLYIDALPGTGVVPADLTDQTSAGQLDDALSSALTTPAGFGADFAWGTMKMPVALRGADAMTGFRNLKRPSDLLWIDSPLPVSGDVAETVCTAGACEARIPLATLGGSGPISLFGRLTDSHGTTFANQTVPMDAPDAPGSVSRLLELTR